MFQNNNIYVKNETHIHKKLGIMLKDQSGRISRIQVPHEQ